MKKLISILTIVTILIALLPNSLVFADSVSGYEKLSVFDSNAVVYKSKTEKLTSEQVATTGKVPTEGNGWGPSMIRWSNVELDGGIAAMSLFVGDYNDRATDSQWSLWVVPADEDVFWDDETNDFAEGYEVRGNDIIGLSGATANSNAWRTGTNGTPAKAWQESEVSTNIMWRNASKDMSACSGTYNIYLIIWFCDFYGIQFHDVVVENDENIITMSNDTDATNDITQATEVSVSNTVSVTTNRADVKAELFLGVYDEYHNPLYIERNHELIEDSDDIVITTEILDADPDVMSGAAYVGAFLVVGGKLIKSNYISRVVPATPTQTYEEGVSATSAESTITVTGKAKETSGSVMVYLKDGNSVLYINEVPTNAGSYEFTFSPDIPTDTYTIEVVDSKNNKQTTTVDFISYKQIIAGVSGAGSWQEVESHIGNNSDIFGIDTSLATDTGDSDWIYNKIYQNRAEAQSVAAIKDLYHRYVALAIINNGDVASAIDSYSAELGLLSSYLFIYSEQEDGADKLNSAVAEAGGVESTEDFLTIFYDEIVAANVNDAYTVMAFLDQTDRSEGFGTSEGVIGDTAGGRYVKFPMLDFGNVVPKTLAITYGVPDNYANKPVKIFIDDKTKATADITVTTQATGDWNNFKTHHIEITDEVAEKLEGVHDIYVVFTTTGQGNWKDLSFTKEYFNVDDFTLTLNDSEGSETQSPAEATEVDLSAYGYAYTGRTNNVYSVLAAYDAEGSLIDIDSGSAENFDREEFDVSIQLDNLSDVSSVYAGVFDEELKSMIRSKTVGLRSASASSQTKLAQSSDGVVSIYGKAEDAQYVTMFVRKSDVGVTDFADYALVYEATTANDIFSYKFKMPDRPEFNTGEYVITVIDDNGNVYEDTFRYSSPTDILNALTVINAESIDTPAEMETALNSTSNPYGIDLEEIFGLDLAPINQSANKTDIYNNILSARGEGFSSAASVKNAVNAAKAVDSVNTGASPYDTFKNNAKSFGLAEDVYYTKYFVNLDADKFNTEYGTTTTASGISDAVTKFKTAVIISAFYGEMAWGNIDNMFNDFNDILQLEKLDTYNGFIYDKKYAVCNNFVGVKTLSTIALIRDKFNTSYNQADTIIINPGSPGGNSSPGGNTSPGRFAGGAVPAPKAETPTQEGAVNTSFTDLTGYEWASDAIKALTSKGIINGKGNGTFDPAAPITREEFVKILILAFGNTDDAEDVHFSDVNTGAWYYPYIKAAASKGIVTGYQDGSFGVGKNITREEIAVMVSRAISEYKLFINENIDSVSFIDFDDAADYARESVMYLARAQVLNGVGNDMYMPKNNTKRAEAAVIIYRVLNN